MVHVPYKSAPAANTDLMAKNIRVTVDSLTTLAPQLRSGKERSLAVTSPRRSQQLPQVPTTMSEAGGRDSQMLVWGGVVVPKGFVAPVIRRLADEITAVLALPEVEARLAELSYGADTQGPAEFGEFIKKENKHCGAAIRRANIKAD